MQLWQHRLQHRMVVKQQFWRWLQQLQAGLLLLLLGHHLHQLLRLTH
jgi:hypothetical protein